MTDKSQKLTISASGKGNHLDVRSVTNYQQKAIQIRAKFYWADDRYLRRTLLPPYLLLTEGAFSKKNKGNNLFTLIYGH